LETDSREKYGISWSDIKEMEHVLWRTGRIETKTWAPR
jgi:hypothetical protein